MALLLAAVGMALEVWRHFVPGALSQDSFSILQQARSWKFEDGHPPLMAVIWWILDGISPGSHGMLLLNLGMFYGGLFLIFQSCAERLGIPGVFGIFFVGLFPPVTAILGVIWIDITMAGFFILALGISELGRSSNSRRISLVFFISALALTIMGMAMRHNAAAAAFPIFVMLLFRFSEKADEKFLALWRAVCAGAVVTVLFFILISKVSENFVDVKRHLWRVGAIYDIAGTSFYHGKYLFSPDVVIGADLEDIKKLYSARSAAPLAVGVQIHALKVEDSVKGNRIEPNLSSPDINSQLLSNWKEVILEYPTAYLMHRYAVFVSLVTRSPWGLWTTIFDAVYPNDLGIEERSASDSAYFAFVRRIATQTDVFVPVWYLALSVIGFFPALVMGVRAGGGIWLLSASLYGSGLAHMAGLFFLAASSDSRYSHWLITATVLATTLITMQLLRCGWCVVVQPVLRQWRANSTHEKVG